MNIIINHFNSFGCDTVGNILQSGHFFIINTINLIFSWIGTDAKANIANGNAVPVYFKHYMYIYNIYKFWEVYHVDTDNVLGDGNAQAVPSFQMRCSKKKTRYIMLSHIMLYKVWTPFLLLCGFITGHGNHAGNTVRPTCGGPGPVASCLGRQTAATRTVLPKKVRALSTVQPVCMHCKELLTRGTPNVYLPACGNYTRSLPQY